MVAADGVQLVPGLPGREVRGPLPNRQDRGAVVEVVAAHLVQPVRPLPAGHPAVAVVAEASPPAYLEPLAQLAEELEAVEQMRCLTPARWQAVLK